MQRIVRKVEQEYVSGFLVHNLTIEGDHTFAVGADALLVHNTASCPNPYGQHGKPDHRAAVSGLVEKAAAEFPDDIIHQGTSINSKTGLNRRPDVWVEDAITGLVKKVYEAARTNADGTIVSREQLKQFQYNAFNLISECFGIR